MKHKGVYIPSVDAKDLYLAEHGPNQAGYSLKRKDGAYNLRKFTNSLDYSLDFIELSRIYYRKFRRKDFSFQIDKHSYSAHVINLTFKYSVKEWNQVNWNTYIKLGQDYINLTFEDCIARDSDGEIAGIRLGETVLSPAGDLPACFCANGNQYRRHKDPKTIKTSADLRREFYKNGFICDGAKYCRLKRSSGSARIGKCLFIREDLFTHMSNYSSGNFRIKGGQEIDLAAYESYISLTSSSILDTLPIAPENILLIGDYESVFREDVIETHNENGWLMTSEKNCEIVNSIWDGQSLVDKSLLGVYSGYGMVLLRNLMFKSCCFNCEIQKWLRDHNITDISQLNGKTRAKRVEDIKLITTPSSIKYLKFDTWDHWQIGRAHV